MDQQEVWQEYYHLVEQFKAMVVARRHWFSSRPWLTSPISKKTSPSSSTTKTTVRPAVPSKLPTIPPKISTPIVPPNSASPPPIAFPPPTRKKIEHPPSYRAEAIPPTMDQAEPSQDAAWAAKSGNNLPPVYMPTPLPPKQIQPSPALSLEEKTTVIEKPPVWLSSYFTQLQAERQKRMPEERSIALKTMEQNVQNCQKCELCQHRTHTVFGSGVIDPILAVVGEAPGADEDIQGLPFVGKAGELLTKMLKSIGIEREQIYICNTIKCRPPGNREPTPEESGLCLPWLTMQLWNIMPQVILAVGSYASHAIVGDGKKRTMTLLRSWNVLDNPFRYRKTIPTFFTFHPSYLLRQPEAKKEAYRDLLILKRFLEFFG